MDFERPLGRVRDKSGPVLAGDDQSGAIVLFVCENLIEEIFSGC